jgi:hypothetical protein
MIIPNSPTSSTEFQKVYVYYITVWLHISIHYFIPIGLDISDSFMFMSFCIPLENGFVYKSFDGTIKAII